MADWFKFFNDGLDEPRFQFAISEQPLVTSVWLVILSEASKQRSSKITWRDQDFELLGFARKINVSPPILNQCVLLLERIGYIKRENGNIAIPGWESLQSNYAKGLDRGYYKSTNKTLVSNSIVSTTRGEERRGEESRRDKKGASNESRPPSLGEWLEALKKNPAYEGIDVGREYGKMCAWCETNRKQATQRRFINWLNRADKPIHSISKPIQESLSVFGLTKVIEAKQKIVTDLKNRFCSEGPLSRTWSDEQARIDCSKLCTEIKQLNTKLAKMA